MTELLAEELVAWLRECFPAMTAVQEAELFWRLIAIEREARGPHPHGPRLMEYLDDRRQRKIFNPPPSDLSDPELDPAACHARLTSFAREVRQALEGKKRG